MSTYQHIFFDLDHTLWDFERNADETLRELYQEYALSDIGKFDYTAFKSTFDKVNRELWSLYNHSLIDREGLRSTRFPLIFEKLGADPALLPPDFGHQYYFRCPHKPHLMPHCTELLEYLSSRYQLHIITNGFDDVQSTKLKSGNIEKYFKIVVTSETTGFRKPDTRIFEHAFVLSGAEPSESLMVGDNLETDIGGAVAAGLDTAFYNPHKTQHQQYTRFEVQCLSDLKNYL